MNQEPYSLHNRDRRDAVLAAIREVCSHRGWVLMAAHVRSTHVHFVVSADDPPGRVMGDCKAYASRALALVDGVSSGRKRWARHGSTRWIWKSEDVLAAIWYVVEEQGSPMAVFRADVRL